MAKKMRPEGRMKNKSGNCKALTEISVLYFYTANL
jgi:hypothetical protein